MASTWKYSPCQLPPMQSEHFQRTYPWYTLGIFPRQIPIQLTTKGVLKVFTNEFYKPNREVCITSYKTLTALVDWTSSVNQPFVWHGHLYSYSTWLVLVLCDLQFLHVMSNQVPPPGFCSSSRSVSLWCTFGVVFRVHSSSLFNIWPVHYRPVFYFTLLPLIICNPLLPIIIDSW